MEDTGIILKEKIKDFVNLGESAEIEFKLSLQLSCVTY